MAFKGSQSAFFKELMKNVPIRLLIADDDPTIRLLLRRLFEHAGWEVCGECANGIEALEKALKLAPDIVILDLAMPGMKIRKRFEVSAEDLRAKNPDVSSPVFDDARNALLVVNLEDASSTFLKLGCLDASDGRVLWAHDLKAEFGGKEPSWGNACSPRLAPPGLASAALHP